MYLKNKYKEASSVLQKIALFLELGGKNPFKVKAILEWGIVQRG
jgi:hypothetical protein